MFGHDDKDQSKKDEPLASSLPDPVPDGSLGSADESTSTMATVADDDTDDSRPSVVVPNKPSDDEPEEDLLPAHASNSPAGLDETDSSDTDELLNIKQQALNQLSPLVSHLEQTPEERFRTLMMMIQAADNQALIKDAYKAAQDIADEKARAQALLDIVNEINYFTQQNKT